MGGQVVGSSGWKFAGFAPNGGMPAGVWLGALNVPVCCEPGPAENPRSLGRRCAAAFWGPGVVTWKARSFGLLAPGLGGGVGGAVFRLLPRRGPPRGVCPTPGKPLLAFWAGGFWTSESVRELPLVWIRRHWSSPAMGALDGG